MSACRRPGNKCTLGGPGTWLSAQEASKGAGRSSSLPAKEVHKCEPAWCLGGQQQCSHELIFAAHKRCTTVSQHGALAWEANSGAGRSSSLLAQKRCTTMGR
eukprot:scaffold100094_cov17-Tisochrysis_lutea.AAC.1